MKSAIRHDAWRIGRLAKRMRSKLNHNTPLSLPCGERVRVRSKTENVPHKNYATKARPDVNQWRYSSLHTHFFIQRPKAIDDTAAKSSNEKRFFVEGTPSADKY